MNKSTKVCLIVASVLVILGAALFAAIMSISHWDFMKLGTTELETNTHLITQNFDNISIESKTADIIFVPSTDNTCTVVCSEFASEKHNVMVQNDTLTIQAVNTGKWYNYIGITIGSPQLVISLPDTAYETLYIKESTGDINIPEDFLFQNIDITTSTGDIYVKGVSASEMALSVSTGKVVGESITCEGNLTINVSTGDTYLTDITCASLLSDGSTGHMSLQNVIVSNKISLVRSTGDIKFDQLDASELFIETDTGDVTGSLLTDKTFFIETDTGDIDVPKSLNGGPCEITTSTGDVRITVK